MRNIFKQFQNVAIINKSNTYNSPRCLYTSASVRFTYSDTFHITTTADDDEEEEEDSNNLEDLRKTTKISVKTADP
jgi:hypothetical protein